MFLKNPMEISLTARKEQSCSVKDTNYLLGLNFENEDVSKREQEAEMLNQLYT